MSRLPASRPLALGLVVLIAGLVPLAAARPATAQSPAQSYLFQEKRFRNACQPPLKFAAGACVRRCPAGYQDMGATCRYRSMRW